MQRTRTTEAAQRVGDEIVLQGWLHQFRELGKVNFLILRDGWGSFQAFVDEPETLELLRSLQVESVIEVTGRVVAEPQAPGGAELHETRVRAIVPINEPPPLELNKKEMKASLDVFLEHAPIGLRHPKRRAILRLAAGAVAGFRSSLNAEHFTEIQSPKIVGTATEGGANVFEVDYFGQPAYLTQSPQFYKQLAVGIFERVYEVGPAFRAEPSATTRHLAQYSSLDVEFGFIEDHRSVMALLNRVLAGILGHLESEYSSELSLLKAQMPTVPKEIPSIYFPEAQELLFTKYKIDARGEPDLAPEHERVLGQWAKEQYGSEFLFVTGYPLAKRPFYTHPNPTDPRFSNSFDLLFRGVELVTGGQRLHRYEEYLAALEGRGMSAEPFMAYLEGFKYGMPPHGGFAIGLERLLMQLLGLPNLRLAALFPRDLTRVTP